MYVVITNDRKFVYGVVTWTYHNPIYTGFQSQQSDLIWVLNKNIENLLRTVKTTVVEMKKLCTTQKTVQ
jgi:hypothetical protein